MEGQCWSPESTVCAKQMRSLEPGVCTKQMRSLEPGLCGKQVHVFRQHVLYESIVFDEEFLLDANLKTQLPHTDFIY